MGKEHLMVVGDHASPFAHLEASLVQRFGWLLHLAVGVFAVVGIGFVYQNLDILVAVVLLFHGEADGGVQPDSDVVQIALQGFVCCGTEKDACRGNGTQRLVVVVIAVVNLDVNQFNVLVVFQKVLD